MSLLGTNLMGLKTHFIQLGRYNHDSDLSVIVHFHQRNSVF